MFTKGLWEIYIDLCWNGYYFEASYILLMWVLIITPLTIIADIVSSPLQILSLIVGHVLNKKIKRN